MANTQMCYRGNLSEIFLFHYFPVIQAVRHTSAKSGI